MEAATGMRRRTVVLLVVATALVSATLGAIGVALVRRDHGERPHATAAAGPARVTDPVPAGAAGTAPAAAATTATGVAPAGPAAAGTVGGPAGGTGAPPALPPPTAPAPGAAVESFAEPKAVTDRVVAAWQAGDRMAAAQDATETAVDQLFALAWSPRDRFSDCSDDGLGDVICSYSYDRGGYVQLYVQQRGAVWTVGTVRVASE